MFIFEQILNSWLQVACQYVAFRSVEDNGTVSKVSDNFFAGIKVLKRCYKRLRF